MVKPEEVKEKSLLLENENFKFRQFLRNRVDSNELDKNFKKLHNEIFANYDCCQCTNCCKVYGVIIGQEELTKISKYLNMSERDFFAAYLELADYEDDSQFKIRESLCPFLQEDGRCQVNECKPDVCKEYPFTDHPNRISSMYNVISMTAVCPVVLEILERLKTIFDFKR
ncbi:MAG: YkgJ family cysteine cluster protein [Oscillospiraceae bacterium]|nr:YkgJ family cysteine cluster protein [Oscillospiraceae bacterium]